MEVLELVTDEGVFKVVKTDETTCGTCNDCDFSHICDDENSVFNFETCLGLIKDDEHFKKKRL